MKKALLIILSIILYIIFYFLFACLFILINMIIYAERFGTTLEKAPNTFGIGPITGIGGLISFWLSYKVVKLVWKKLTKPKP